MTPRQLLQKKQLKVSGILEWGSQPKVASSIVQPSVLLQSTFRDIVMKNQTELGSVKYIFWVSYEINPTDYKHLASDVEAFSTDTTEVLLQLIGTIIWAKQHHHFTKQMPDPCIPIQFYSASPSFCCWKVPDEPRRGNTSDCRQKSKDHWIYLVCLLQFWKDNIAEFRIWQGLIRPMSVLAKFGQGHC